MSRTAAVAKILQVTRFSFRCQCPDHVTQRTHVFVFGDLERVTVVPSPWPALLFRETVFPLQYNGTLRVLSFKDRGEELSSSDDRLVPSFLPGVFTRRSRFHTHSRENHRNLFNKTFQSMSPVISRVKYNVKVSGLLDIPRHCYVNLQDIDDGGFTFTNRPLQSSLI